MNQQNKWKSICDRKFRWELTLDVEHCSPIALRSIILDVNTSGYILDLIAQAYSDDELILRELVLCQNLNETTLAFIALTASEEIKSFIAATRVMDVVSGEQPTRQEEDSPVRKKKLNLTQQLQKMTMSQKIKLAMSGTKEARGMLIRESSKIVALGVLTNPRITIGEVEFFAKSTNLSEDVIRKIGTNTEWSRKPAISSALVNNPKTPVGISLGFLVRLSVRELAILEKNRNVPAAVRTAARSMLAKKKSGSG
jgi:hypothetical protein